MCDLDIVHSLPAAFAWIKEANYNLIRLSDVSWNDCLSTIGKGGHMFIDSELGRRSTTEFTMWRWTYWFKRLHGIRELAKETSQDRLEYTIDGIDLMVSEVEERNSYILRAYKTSGDLRHENKHLLCLKWLVEGEISESESPQEMDDNN